jgi:hypothetical protein
MVVCASGVAVTTCTAGACVLLAGAPAGSLLDGAPALHASERTIRRTNKEKGVVLRVIVEAPFLVDT